jgi:CxxC motif-containing protein (DUF1111 family)
VEHRKSGWARVCLNAKSLSMLLALATVGLLTFQVHVESQTTTAITQAQDPGVRGGPAGAGDPLPGLVGYQAEYFQIGKEDFEEVEDVADGMGPRMNLDSCVGCHSQPATGGTSPAINPQIAFASGGSDSVPPFLSLNGPVREARFVRNKDGSPDGGVHALFTVTGREGAGGCSLTQPDFAAQVAARNVVFRIPTPTFGAGLMELVPDWAILANRASAAAAKSALGIRGRPNYAVAGRTISGQTNNNGNDGTISRFGWKAQNKSLLLFAGEAYNVEMGISNDLFQTERDETEGCRSVGAPNSVTDTDTTSAVEAMSSIEKFAFFMRFLAPPTPFVDPAKAVSIGNGATLFQSVGCAYCHTPSFVTGSSKIPALSNQPVNLFSDLLVHDMGVGLADGVSQGSANGREFRTAPLWGVGQRIFFLHDGRASDLVTAIKAHASGFSEANGAVSNYQNLTTSQKQDLLNFLRSL